MLLLRFSAKCWFSIIMFFVSNNSIHCILLRLRFSRENTFKKSSYWTPNKIMLLKQHIKTLDLRGQAIRLQALDSMVGPRPLVAQSRPPLDGAGLSQVRYLCITPPPHVTSQADQSLHFEYPPSSVNEEKYKHVWEKFYETDKKHINTEQKKRMNEIL